ncbi:MAG: exonuclease domain-containing protein, partial [Planctomycetales bacterium]
DFSDAGTLAEACRVLKSEYDGKNRLWASYGDYDRNQIERNCKDLGVGYPFGKTHLNVKNLFAAAMGLPREIGMDGALQRLNIPLEGTHHRGHDDAWNIALILATVLKASRSVIA